MEARKNVTYNRRTRIKIKAHRAEDTTKVQTICKKKKDYDPVAKSLPEVNQWRGERTDNAALRLV
jgi:transposase